MKRNSDRYLTGLQAQLELDSIPAAVEEKLRQVYAELPDQTPQAHKSLPVWLKRGSAGLVSVAAALLFLLGVNGANPALAESLPFIGGVFESFNRGITANNLQDTQAGLANYAALPSGENSVLVPAGGLGQKPVTISVDQVYYDGVYVYAGLVMELEGCSETVYSNDWGSYYNILINDEPQILWEDGEYKQEPGFLETVTYGWWQRVESGRYISQRGFRVPEKYQNQDTLDITLCCQGIEDGATGLTYLANNTPFQLHFTVEKNEAQVRTVAGELEINGITFVSAEAGPAGSIVVFDVAGRYHNPARIIRFDNGQALGVAGAGKTEDLPDGGKRETWFMGGLQPGETRKVVLGLFDKNDTKDWLAVFVIDFENGTVQAGSVEDIKPEPYAGYACGVEAVESLTEGYLVSKFHYSEEKNSLFLLTPEDYRDLRVELWQGSRLIDEVLTEKDEFHWDSPGFHWEYIQQPDGTWTETYLNDLPLNRYFIAFQQLRGFDKNLPATVRVMDRATGETLLEQRMEWNQPNSADPKVTIIHWRNPEVDSIVDEDAEDAVSSQAE